MTQTVSQTNQTRNEQQTTLSVSCTDTQPLAANGKQLCGQSILAKSIELAKFKYLKFSKLNFGKTGTATHSVKYSYVANYINAEATVVEAIFPDNKGKIKLFDIYWPAKVSSHVKTVITAGESVRVVDRDGINLIVQPIEASAYHLCSRQQH